MINRHEARPVPDVLILDMHIAQMFVVCHCQMQHLTPYPTYANAKLISGEKVSQFALQRRRCYLHMRTYRRPVSLRHVLLAHSQCNPAQQFAGQACPSRFAEKARLFPAGAVIAIARAQLVTRTRARFCPAFQPAARHCTAASVEIIGGFWRRKQTFGRSQHCCTEVQLLRGPRGNATRARYALFRLFQMFTVFFVQIAVATAFSPSQSS